MDRAGDDNEPRRRRIPDGDTIVLWLGLATAVGLSVWLTWGIWGAGMPAGDDTAAHVVRADYALEHFFRVGSLDGWQSSFGLGYQEFLFIGPGFSLLIAAIQLVTLGTLSTLDATKAATVVAFALVPLSVAFLAWAFGLGKRAAGIAAVLALVVSSSYGGSGLTSIFGSGLLPNHLGSALLGFSFGGVVLVLRRPSTRRIVFTAAAAAALVATHPIAAIILGFLSTALVLAAGTEWFAWHASAITGRIAPWLDRVAPSPADRPDRMGATGPSAGPAPHPADPADPARAGGSTATAADPGGPSWWVLLDPAIRRLVALAAAGFLAIGMAGFVLVPLLAHGDLRGENSAWPDVPIGTRLLGIWRGEFLYRPWVALLVVIGFGFLVLLALGRRRGALTLALTPIGYLVLARAFITITPDNIVAIQLTNRSIANVGLIAVLPLAALLAAPRRVAERVALATGTVPRAGDPVYLVANAVIPVVLAALIVLLPSGLERDQARVVVPTPSLQALADELRAVVPDGARFATQRLPAQERVLTGMSHPDLWLAWATGENTLNIYNLESSLVFEPVYEAEHLNDRPPAEVAARLSRLGVSHLAVIDTADIPGIMSSAAFSPVWRDGTMAILAVHPVNGQPEPADLLTADQPVGAALVGRDPQHLTIDASAVGPTTATVAVGWSPKWRVTVDGATVPTERTEDDLVAVRLPGGPSRITLDYGLDTADLVGRALTALSLALAIAALVVARRERRVERRPDPAHPGADDPASGGDGSVPAPIGNETGPGDPVSPAGPRATMGR